MATLPYQLLADAVLILHFGVVLFVVGGLMCILVGNAWRWRWVNAWGFRLAHLAAILIVVALSWLGEVCPLTALESWLRVQAGACGYSQSFVEHWVQAVLYYEAPFWVFVLAYTLFALAVLACWWRYPPRRAPHEPHA
ncbi:hypothetical protein AZ34_06620 [Hylemonella gracilis str. Niagara R]|uniref:DUF2784 domain-containing protein n=1 Tax=Hylemonella gracilis str. Niagara R TaxID=1458275 RepID=A0A016XGR9_9BURK|nr:DUF2784 domain-containing protein [Hylemonella gracilis]EYC50772.1 hypothetical protein AZ34_06620 [Hylemonella gracilis str. Niagara R]